MSEIPDASPVPLEEEMERSYLDYAMSVIVARALPDAADGLKPVHRRIFYSMHEQGCHAGKPHRKSARVVGDVIGKYHPHGEKAIYDAMTRMAQDFSMRMPLLDGQGNFGSMDGDAPAAMRYTEIRLNPQGECLLEDIDSDTVDFRPNYDGSTREPVQLAARFPNLLINGASGIAVGMATSIPPHNPGEAIDACLALLDDPGLGTAELMRLVPGPDFPTGGIIMGRGGIRSTYETGRGSIVMRGRTHVEDIRGERQAIVIDEIPFQQNKAVLVERIADAVRQKRIEGISDLRDESNREGVRIVIELRRGNPADVVLNQLFRHTPLQSSFSANMVALRRGRPELMGLRAILSCFLDFRQEIILRRTRFLLDRARNRAHELVGLAIAVVNIDDFVRLIRESASPAEARREIVSRWWPVGDMAPVLALIDDHRSTISGGQCRLGEDQAQAILELRLQRLTNLGRGEIDDEIRRIAAGISGYLELLGSRDRLLACVREELAATRDRFPSVRRTDICTDDAEHDDEDLIRREEMVVTVSRAGYVKRVPLNSYRLQRRGGRGRTGMSTRDEDFVSHLFVASTHAEILFFTSIGRVYKLKVWRLPSGPPQGRGRSLVNLLPLAPGETVCTVTPMPEGGTAVDDLSVILATARGNVRRNPLADFASINAAGKIAMKFGDDDAGDQLVGVAICPDDRDVLLCSHRGMAIRFRALDLREFRSRGSTGVRGMRLDEGDRVISLAILDHLEASREELQAWLRHSGRLRRQGDDGGMDGGVSGHDGDGARDGDDGEEERGEEEQEEQGEETVLSPGRLAYFSAGEQFLLLCSDRGHGLRLSACEFAVQKRGGRGVIAFNTRRRDCSLVAAFPVEDSDQVMILSDTGQVIRCPVDGIRIAARGGSGVMLFRPDGDETVVSAVRLGDPGGEEAADGETRDSGGDTGDGDTGGGDTGDGGPDPGHAAERGVSATGGDRENPDPGGDAGGGVTGSGKAMSPDMPPGGVS